MATVFLIIIYILVGYTSSFYLDILCENPTIEQLIGSRSMSTVLKKNITDVVCGRVQISATRSNITRQAKPKFSGVLKIKRYPPSRAEISFDVFSTGRGVFLMTKENNVSKKFGTVKVCEEDTLIIEIPEWNEIHVYSGKKENNHSSNIEGKIEVLAQLNRYRKQEIKADSGCINFKDDVRIKLLTPFLDKREIDLMIYRHDSNHQISISGRAVYKPWFE